jgi:hypothetical protein
MYFLRLKNLLHTRFCYKVEVYNFFLNFLNICVSCTKEDIASEEN